MRAIAILAAIAMVAGLFMPWLKPQVVGLSLVPWDVAKELDPNVETLQKLASDSPALLAFLATFALAALFLALAILGAPSRMLAFLAGGGAVGMMAYAVLRLGDRAASLGLPRPTVDNLGDLARRLPEVAGAGAMAWAGGAAVLLLTALIGFPSRR